MTWLSLSRLTGARCCQHCKQVVKGSAVELEKARWQVVFPRCFPRACPCQGIGNVPRSDLLSKWEFGLPVLFQVWVLDVFEVGFWPRKEFPGQCPCLCRMRCQIAPPPPQGGPDYRVGREPQPLRQPAFTVICQPLPGHLVQSDPCTRGGLDVPAPRQHRLAALMRDCSVSLY